MKKLILPALLAAALLSLNVMGQTDKKESGTSAADTASIDSIIGALYESISGGSGVARDWDRFRNLFHADARLIPTGKDASSGVLNATSFTPDGYIKRAEPFLMKNGFFEKETARRTLVFGGIAHIFSTYEGRNKESDAKPLVRGINSIQLLNDGKRWWIISVYWQAESPDNPLPGEFLKDG